MVPAPSMTQSGVASNRPNLPGVDVDQVDPDFMQAAGCVLV
jgi:hypothetical protein